MPLRACRRPNVRSTAYHAFCVGCGITGPNGQAASIGATEMALTFTPITGQRRALEQRIYDIQQELPLAPPAKRVELIQEIGDRVGDVLRGVETARQIVQVGGQVLAAAGVL